VEKTGKTIIEVQGLEHYYPDGTSALRGIDLKIQEGDSVAVVGSNGAGKTTFTKHLNGILRATEGKVIIDGMVISDDNLPAIHSIVGMVFQDPDNMLFCPTLYDDIAFGPLNFDVRESEIEKKVKKSLDAVGLLPLMDKQPHNLSYGQRKRAAVAAVLSMVPKIIVFDEVTANLDTKNEKAVMDIISSLPNTKIIISHDLQILYNLCKRVLIFSAGKLEEDISMDAFISDRARMRKHGLDFRFRCDACTQKVGRRV